MKGFGLTSVSMAKDVIAKAKADADARVKAAQDSVAAMMAKGSMRIHPGTAHVIFHAPVYPADYASRAELSEAVVPSD